MWDESQRPRTKPLSKINMIRLINKGHINFNVTISPTVKSKKGKKDSIPIYLTGILP